MTNRPKKVKLSDTNFAKCVVENFIEALKQMKDKPPTTPTTDPFEAYEIEHYLEHHQDLVKRLAKPGEAIVAELTPEKAHLLHMVVGVSGEAGELLDCIKKHVIYGKELDVDNVVEEIGDIYFYIQGILNQLELIPEVCIKENIIKLEKRYGSTYSNEAAQARVDKA